jgi:hypothetical protein
MSNIPIVDVPLAGDLLVNKDGTATHQLQALLESIQEVLNTGKQNEYTVATVPDATQCEGCIIYVSDETGGATLAFSNNVNWLRVQDRVIIS